MVTKLRVILYVEALMWLVYNLQPSIMQLIFWI